MVGAMKNIFLKVGGAVRGGKRDARGKETPDFVGAPLRRGGKHEKKILESYELTFGFGERLRAQKAERVTIRS